MTAARSVAPTISVNPVPPNIGNATPITVTFTANDAGGSGVASVTWNRAEGGGASGSAVFSAGSWSASVALVAKLGAVAGARPHQAERLLVREREVSSRPDRDACYSRIA